jgi:hypothetical protein
MQGGYLPSTSTTLAVGLHSWWQQASSQCCKPPYVDSRYMTAMRVAADNPAAALLHFAAGESDERAWVLFLRLRCRCGDGVFGPTGLLRLWPPNTTASSLCSCVNAAVAVATTAAAAAGVAVTPASAAPFCDSVRP